jgi:sortase A
VLVVTTAMLILAAVAGWSVLQVLGLSAISQARSQTVVRNELREQLAAETAPLGGVIEPGSPVALLTIPTLGLEQVVVEGTASGDTMAGPGHRRDTVLPGQQGVAIVYGRATAYGAPFRSVPSLRAGDGITVTTGQGEFTYRVDGVRRDGDPLPGALAVGGGRLTLVTMEGTGQRAAVTGFSTVYVDATLLGEAAVGPGGRPAAVPAAEKAMAGDPSALPLLVLVLQALLLPVLGIGLVRATVPARALWVIAAPALLAAAWLSTDVAARLLPNLF